MSTRTIADAIGGRHNTVSVSPAYRSYKSKCDETKMGKIRTRNTSDSSFRNAVSKDENELVGNRDQLKVLVQNNSDEIQREPLLKAMEEGRWDAPSLLDFAHMMRTKIDQLKSEIPDCSSAIEREAVESLLSEGKLDTARLSIESLENSHGVSDPKGY